MASSLQDQKARFRKRFKAALDDISSEEVERQSTEITRRVLQLEEYHHARSISVFLSMPGKEIMTRDIVVQAFKDGKKVFVPYIHTVRGTKSKTMDMLRLLNVKDLESLQPDAWGIPSLSKASIPERENAVGGAGCLEDMDESIRGSPTLDLIFVPAMAFDHQHNRLGHGKGFYDRYLTKYQELAKARQQERTVPQLVGLALREQLLLNEQLPTSDTDWKVDRVVSVGL